ncbi:MAG: nuclear transport factor 2 family protein, partial [Micromonosporaceae bacterium]
MRGARDGGAGRAHRRGRRGGCGEARDGAEPGGALVTGPESAAALRAEIDAVLADWAWHIDHREFDELAGLFTEDARFVTGPVELRGRQQI